MDIMNMTLGQILNGLTHNIILDVAILSGLLNLEVIVRQYAVENGYTKAVNICDRVAKFIKGATDILKIILTKQAPQQKVD